MGDSVVIKDLGGGLVLRRATREDAEGVLALHGDVLHDPAAQEPNPHVLAWSRDLLEREHPTFEVGDFTVVQDTRSGTIVSSLCLISQTWSYGGIAFGVGRPELVATLPEYRARGLVRAQFDTIHRWSAERGQRVQAITGIPWFYRQFGYEMGLTLGGGHKGYRPQLPKPLVDEPEPYNLRPATEADLPFVARLYEAASARYLVAAVRDAAVWRYELERSPNSFHRMELRVVEERDGPPVGFLAHMARLEGGSLWVQFCELADGVPWNKVMPSLLRYLASAGEALAAQDDDNKEQFSAFGFDLVAGHPVFRLFPDMLPRVYRPYAWYVRVADLPGFVRHVAPVLEQRLAASALSGHSGELKISFYRSGLRLVLENGQLKEVEPWQPSVPDGGQAAFPDLTFLQLLFGYRSFEELDYAFADCWASNDETRALLEALFPKQPSFVWPIA